VIDVKAGWMASDRHLRTAIWKRKHLLNIKSSQINQIDFRFFSFVSLSSCRGLSQARTQRTPQTEGQQLSLIY